MLVKGFMKVDGLLEQIFAVDAIGNVFRNCQIRTALHRHCAYFDKPGSVWYRVSPDKLAGTEFIGNYNVPRIRKERE